MLNPFKIVACTCTGKCLHIPTAQWSVCITHAPVSEAPISEQGRLFLALACAAWTANFTNSSLNPSRGKGALARAICGFDSVRGTNALCPFEADVSSEIGGLAVVPTVAAGRFPICRNFFREPPIHASISTNTAVDQVWVLEAQDRILTKWWSIATLRGRGACCVLRAAYCVL